MTGVVACTDLPVFSGPCPPCPKCGLPRGKAVGTSVRYLADDGIEMVERACGVCGFTWRERCADADFEPCPDCGGFTGAQECQECADRRCYRDILA